MDKTLRSILLVLIGLVILSSFSTGWFFLAKESLYNDYVDLEDLFKTSVERLNSELASSQRDNKELSKRLEVVEKELNVLESKNNAINFKYKGILEEKDYLDKELVRVKKGKFYLEKKLKEIKSDRFIAGLLRENVSLDIELKRLKESLVPKDSKIESMSIEISRLSKEVSELEKKAKDFIEVAEVLSKDLLKEKQRFEKLFVEDHLLKIKLAEKKDDVDKFKDLVTDKSNLQIKLYSMEKELVDKNEELYKLKLAFRNKVQDEERSRAEAYHAPEEVDLPRIILDNRMTYSKRSMSLGQEGRILTVNADHDFVVIDLGRQDGIDLGTIFDVYRRGRIIGCIETIQTRERISACDIVDLEEGMSIEIDNVVIEQ